MAIGNAYPGALGVGRVLVSTDTFGVSAAVLRESRRRAEAGDPRSKLRTSRHARATSSAVATAWWGELGLEEVELRARGVEQHGEPASGPRPTAAPRPTWRRVPATTARPWHPGGRTAPARRPSPHPTHTSATTGRPDLAPRRRPDLGHITGRGSLSGDPRFRRWAQRSGWLCFQAGGAGSNPVGSTRSER